MVYFSFGSFPQSWNIHPCKGQDPFLLLQRLTAMQVRSSVRLMPQNQPSGRGLLPSPTAWSPDQHPAAMLADVSLHIWAGLKDMVWGLVSLSALTKGSVWNANPLQMGTQTTVPCAQAEDSGLLGPLQSPNWVKVCLISTIVFLPVSIVLRDRILYWWLNLFPAQNIFGWQRPEQQVCWLWCWGVSPRVQLSNTHASRNSLIMIKCWSNTCIKYWSSICIQYRV